jgi:hypothetical protein
MDRLTTRDALAIGHKLRLLERVQPPVEAGGSLLVPCPQPGCPSMLTVQPADADWPLTLAGCWNRHRWTLAHRACVELVVRDYLGWYRDRAAEPLPF